MGEIRERETGRDRKTDSQTWKQGQTDTVRRQWRGKTPKRHKRIGKGARKGWKTKSFDDDDDDDDEKNDDDEVVTTMMRL